MPKLGVNAFVADRCRASYFQFLQTFWHVVTPERLKLNWHIEKLCLELQTLSERIFEDLPRLHDLIVNCPPGTSKSRIVSVLWQPWTWTRMPSFKMITGSYSERLSLELARLSRDVVQSSLYKALFPGIDLREDQNTKGLFVNTHGGWRFSTGVGGSATGFHAHAIAVDDPIDPQGALSDLVLAEANSWMKETLSDRKVDKQLTPTVLIMQRLHQNDPTGHWLDRGGRIRHICLPADDTWEIKPPEWRGYYVDGLLDPVRQPREPVLSEALARGDEYYASQYGMNPVPRGGALFKVDNFRMENLVNTPKKWKRNPMRFWDKAATAGGGAKTAGVKMALDEYDDVWVLDMVLGQWNSGDRERKLLETARLDGKLTTVGIEREPAGSGKESAERSAKMLALAGFPSWINRVTGSKEIRADPWSVMVNQGHVHIVRGPWNHAFIEEHRYFPFSTFKDIVDASSGCFCGLTRRRLRIGILGEKHGERAYRAAQ